MRLIDADALIGRDVGIAWISTEAIEKATTIEAETVKHGRWIDHMVRDWRCSECGEAVKKVRKVDGYCFDDKPNFCPNCGADMRGE